MKNKQPFVVWCFVFLFVPVVAGCQQTGPDGRLAISGTAAVNGTPIPTGAISFEPVGSPAIKTPSGGAIINGKYSIPMDQGLVPGDYIVKIFGSRNTGEFDDSPQRFPIIEQLVPEKYNNFSKEKVTVAVGETKFDFDLKVEEADFKK